MCFFLASPADAGEAVQLEKTMMSNGEYRASAKGLFRIWMDSARPVPDISPNADRTTRIVTGCAMPSNAWQCAAAMTWSAM